MREIIRVLKPGGHLVFTLFNYYSLFSIFNFLRSNHYKIINNKNKVSRIKDWLKLLNVRLVSSKLGFYNLPVENNNLINKFIFLEHVCQRWLPFTGSIIMIHGVKTISSINLINQVGIRNLKKENYQLSDKIKYMLNVDIYTDGACKGNPGVGGWGFM